jgi:hypothetical protein
MSGSAKLLARIAVTQPRNAMERSKQRWFPRQWKWDVSARRAVWWMKRETGR